MLNKKVIVYHALYGCETGCCGHVIKVGDEEKFEFMHPYGDHKEWAKQKVAKYFGEEHVKDLDWDNCVISDD
jgi:hypothetical protein